MKLPKFTYEIFPRNNLGKFPEWKKNSNRIENFQEDMKQKFQMLNHETNSILHCNSITENIISSNYGK